MAEKYVKLNDIIDTLEYEWGYEGMREDLEKLPTADVVEAVRCKDCKYYVAEYCTRDIKGRTNMFFMQPNDFCSYGERGEI